MSGDQDLAQMTRAEALRIALSGTIALSVWSTPSFAGANHIGKVRMAEAIIREMLEEEVRFEEDRGISNPPVVDDSNPSHYADLDLEPFEVIEKLLSAEQWQGYLAGSAIKYAMRQGRKASSDDATKARVFMKKYRDTYYD